MSATTAEAPGVARSRWAAAALGLGAGVSVWLALDPTRGEGMAVFAAHALLPLVGLGLARVGGAGRSGRVCLTLGLASLLFGALGWVPGPRGLRAGLLTLHVWLGFATLAPAALVVLPVAQGALRLPRFVALIVVAVAAVGPAGAWATLAARRRWSPPRYDARACFRFLTATTVEQAGEPGFPSALRVVAEPAGCEPCHREVDYAHSHAGSGGNSAYRAALAGFAGRRGWGAARWCQGCHSPQSLRSPTGEGSGGVDCEACHGVTEVRALTGSTPLTLGAGAGGAAWEVALRPAAHAHANGNPNLLRAAEFCAGCHRKHYGPAQTEFRWMPVLDPYREWLESGAAGSVFAARRDPASCADCHRPHTTRAQRAPGAKHTVSLRLIARLGGAPQVLDDVLPGAAAGARLDLDVVLVNAAPHAFPAWMPDLYECFLEVEVTDRAGRLALRSNPAATLRYEMDARDRAGQRLTHGELDRAVSLRSARRIPGGEADVVRFTLRVPAGGIGGVRARLVRRARAAGAARVVGEARWGTGRLNPADTVGGAREWRVYGEALTGARAYTQALGALRRAEDLNLADPDTQLALGKLFLQEGDILAARDRFRELLRTHEELGRAWEAVVLRRSGQAEEAARRLEPLARSFPRDPRLRFELGRAYMDLLRHAEAARQFEALLDLDPLDAAAHYNLRLCLLRLNRFAAARREEALYNLLAPETGDPGAPSGPPGRPLQSFPLSVPAADAGTGGRSPQGKH